MRVFVVIKVLTSPSVHLVFEEANLRVRVCDEFLWELGVEVRPRKLVCLRVLFLREQERDL